MTTSFKSIGRVCTACNAERKANNLLYDPETLNPYCSNPYICNENHPNSVQNLIKRQNEKFLVSYAVANEAHEKYLLEQFDSSIVDRIVQIITKPMTVRINNPDLAKFLIELQESEGFDNMSETVRHCIQLMQESKGIFYGEHRRLQEEINTLKEAQEATAAKPKKQKKEKPAPIEELTVLKESPIDATPEPEEDEEMSF